MITIASRDFSFIVEDNLELIFSTFNQVGIQLNLMQNSAISFMSCFNKNDAKTEAILEVLKDKFTVQINSGYTLLTVFNYNDAFNQLDKIIDGRDIALEQKSTSALQLLLIN